MASTYYHSINLIFTNNWRQLCDITSFLLVAIPHKKSSLMTHNPMYVHKIYDIATNIMILPLSRVSIQLPLDFKCGGSFLSSTVRWPRRLCIFPCADPRIYVVIAAAAAATAVPIEWWLSKTTPLRDST